VQDELFDPAEAAAGGNTRQPQPPNGETSNLLASDDGDCAGFWDNAPVIHAYTREQALKDGVLLDVTKTAREAGFKDPVALTAAVHSDVRDIPKSKKGIQDYEGRLWDLLCMSLRAVRAGATCRQEPPLFATFVMHIGRRRNYRAKILIGLGDHGELVLTIARPDED
jgi:hypothetical protein